MKELNFLCGLSVAVLAAAEWWTPASRAADKAGADASPAVIVQQTLQREAREGVEDRAGLLRPAIVQVPEYQPAFWHSGFVYDGKRKEWLRYDEMEEYVSKDTRLAAYRRARDSHPDTLAGHLAMARWCAGQKLDDQARAHLTRVLDFNPDHAEARQSLGHRLVHGNWVGEHEMVEAQARARNAAADLDKWKPKLEKLRQMLHSSSRKQRQAARDELDGIVDPAAVGAIDAVLCAPGGQDALLGLRLLERLVSAESAATLARYAVFSSVREIAMSAAKALRSQREHDYVPLLLGALQSPIYSRAEIYESPGTGQVFYRHVFYRENQDRQDLALMDFTFEHSIGPTMAPPIVIRPQVSAADAARLSSARATSNTRPGAAAYAHEVQRVQGNLDLQAKRGVAAARPQVQRAQQADAETQQDAMDAARMRAAATAAAREAAVARQNLTAGMLNARVSAVLQESTGQLSMISGDQWWNWWYLENECVPPAQKAVRISYQSGYAGSSSPSQVPGVHTRMPVLPGARCDCLAAGTFVWTEAGPLAVEMVQVGDRVFACDPETGRLALKPVLKTTVRPPSPLLKIQMGDEVIQSTGGHVFWVSGEGWLKARDLSAGMNLHTIRGTVPVRRVEDGKTQPAYSLVVEDFHTFFTGQEKVLTHDNTIRKPTNRIVPGLAVAR